MKYPRLCILAGLLLVLAGPFAYMLTMTQAFLRSSGLAAFVFMGAGTALGIFIAVRDRRKWIRAVAVLNVVLTVGFAYAFFVGSQLPSAGTSAFADAIPDFTLPDHNGRPTRLYEELAKGPVMLVFYRGHW